MERRQQQPTTRGSAEMFTGDAWYDVVASGDAPSRVRVSIVRFAPGARTAWHAHALGQTLHVTAGVGRVQERGGDLLEMRPGESFHTPAGAWHWHGAAPDRFMEHLSIWEASEDGPETEWGDHVTDAEYRAQPGNKMP